MFLLPGKFDGRNLNECMNIIYIFFWGVITTSFDILTFHCCLPVRRVPQNHPNGRNIYHKRLKWNSSLKNILSFRVYFFYPAQNIFYSKNWYHFMDRGEKVLAKEHCISHFQFLCFKAAESCIRTQIRGLCVFPGPRVKYSAHVFVSNLTGKDLRWILGDYQVFSYRKKLLLINNLLNPVLKFSSFWTTNPGLMVL